MSTNMDKMSIHFLKDSVQIETVKDGRKSLKNTSLDNISKVLTSNQRTETPFLPGQYGMHKYVRVNNRELYVFSTEPHVREVKFDYHGEGTRSLKPYTVPLPGFVWLITVEHNPAKDTRKYVHGIVYALKNPILSERDRLHLWPFANVASYMCWGSNPVEIGQPKSIQTIPDRFLNNAFNSDLDHNRFNPFDEVVKGRSISRFRTMHLFEHLDAQMKADIKAKKEPKFRYDVLRQAGTLQSVIADEIQQYVR